MMVSEADTWYPGTSDDSVGTRLQMVEVKTNCALKDGTLSF